MLTRPLRIRFRLEPLRSAASVRLWTTKGRAPLALCQPDPWSLSLAEAQRHTEAVHHRAIEVQGALEIVDAHKDTGKHVRSSFDCWVLAEVPIRVNPSKAGAQSEAGMQPNEPPSEYVSDFIADFAPATSRFLRLSQTS